jgi:hypothetical protein
MISFSAATAREDWYRSQPRAMASILCTEAYARQARPWPENPFEDDSSTVNKPRKVITLEIFSLSGTSQLQIMAVQGDKVHQIRGILAREILICQKLEVEVALFIPGAAYLLPCSADVGELERSAASITSIGCILMRCLCPCTPMGFRYGLCRHACPACIGPWGQPVAGETCSATLGACWHAAMRDCDMQGWLLASPLPGLRAPGAPLPHG